MKRALFTALIGLGALIMIVAPAFAHHSAAMFEPTKTITVEGMVKKWELTNPHSWLWVEVTGNDGKTVVWGFEAEGPSTLLRAGIKPSDLKVGTKLTITGRPMQDGQNAAIWVSATRAGGKKPDPAAGFATK